MTFDEQFVILFICQVEGLLKIEIPYLIIGNVLSEQISSQPAKGPSGLAQAVIKIDIDIHSHTSFCYNFSSM